MNNNYKKIEEILEELYLIDSNFRQYDGELKKLIKKLLAIKPDSKFDDNFKAELKIKLLKRIEEIKSQEKIGISKFFDFLFNPKLSYAFSGAILSVLLLIPAIYYVNKSGYLFGQPELDLSPMFSIDSVSDNAFGSLRSIEQVQELGRGGDGSIQEGQVSAPQVMPPEFVSYNYVYKGDDLVLEQDKVEVLKRKKGGGERSGIMNLVNSLDFGIMNLSTFKNSKLSMISFVQDIDFGYGVSVNFSESSVSIHENWETWQYETRSVPTPLEISDVPGDEKLIEMANNFIKEHGINLSMYGDPEVEHSWKTNVPERILVLYPLVINDYYVYDQWGNKFGLRVDVNIRVMKVSGVYNLTSQNYEKSLYEAEMDFAEILKVAGKGGISLMRFPSSGKTVDVEIGTPTLVYMKTWNIQSTETNELLVPAFLFPITKQPEEGTMYQNNIIVPLAKEILFESENHGPVFLLETEQ